jgi:uncharacterized protein with von Willebrand factor type A (vWA) domain
MVLRFVHRLRDAGVPVSMVETLDGVDALRRVELIDREQFRSALRSTLVKRIEHGSTFDSLFDIYFAVHREVPQRAEVTTSLDRPGDAEGNGMDSFVLEATTDRLDETQEPSTQLLAMLLEALRSGDENALRAMASVAVERFAGGAERAQQWPVHGAGLGRLRQRTQVLAGDPADIGLIGHRAHIPIMAGRRPAERELCS